MNRSDILYHIGGFDTRYVSVSYQSLFSDNFKEFLLINVRAFTVFMAKSAKLTQNIDTDTIPILLYRLNRYKYRNIGSFISVCRRYAETVQCPSKDLIYMGISESAEPWECHIS